MIIFFLRFIAGKIDEPNVLHNFLKNMFVAQMCLLRKRILTIIIQEVVSHRKVKRL